MAAGGAAVQGEHSLSTGAAPAQREPRCLLTGLPVRQARRRRLPPGHRSAALDALANPCAGMDVQRPVDGNGHTPAFQKCLPHLSVSDKGGRFLGRTHATCISHEASSDGWADEDAAHVAPLLLDPRNHTSLCACLCGVLVGCRGSHCLAGKCKHFPLVLTPGAVRQAAAQGARRRGAGPAGAGVALGRSGGRGWPGRRHQPRCTPVPHVPLDALSSTRGSPASVKQICDALSSTRGSPAKRRTGACCVAAKRAPALGP